MCNFLFCVYTIYIIILYVFVYKQLWYKECMHFVNKETYNLMNTRCNFSSIQINLSSSHFVYFIQIGKKPMLSYALNYWRFNYTFFAVLLSILHEFVNYCVLSTEWFIQNFTPLNWGLEINDKYKSCSKFSYNTMEIQL